MEVPKLFELIETFEATVETFRLGSMKFKKYDSMSKTYKFKKLTELIFVTSFAASEALNIFTSCSNLRKVYVSIDKLSPKRYEIISKILNQQKNLKFVDINVRTIENLPTRDYKPEFLEQLKKMVK
jgi:hypothetical protein